MLVWGGYNPLIRHLILLLAVTVIVIIQPMPEDLVEAEENLSIPDCTPNTGDICYLGVFENGSRADNSSTENITTEDYAADECSSKDCKEDKKGKEKNPKNKEVDDIEASIGEVDAEPVHVGWTDKECFWFDADVDDDVDKDDYARFQDCLSGDGNYPMEESCLRFDYDGDEDVDESDDLFGVCGSAGGIDYAGFRSDIAEAMLTLKILEQAVTHSTVEDPLDLSTREKLAIEDFLDEVDSKGVSVRILVFGGQLYLLEEEEEVFDYRVEDNADSIDYYIYLKNVQPGGEILALSKDKGQADCEVAYSDDPKYLHSDITCIMTQILEQYPDSSLYLNDNEYMMGAILDYLNAQKAAGNIVDYNFERKEDGLFDYELLNVDFGEDELPGIYELYLRYGDLYGPELPLDWLVEEYNNFTGLKLINGEKRFSYVSDMDIPLAALRAMVSDMPFRIRAKTALEILRTQNPDPTICGYYENFKIFPVETQYNMGELDRLNEYAENADTLCSIQAAVLNISGHYKAWYSTPSLNAKDKLYHSKTFYRALDGTIIAENWDDLTDGFLQSPLNGWAGEPGNDFVITQTDSQGDYAPGEECLPCLSLDRDGDGLIEEDGEDLEAFNECMDRTPVLIRALNPEPSRQELQGFRYAISGDKVVWKDWRSGNGDIYTYDLSTSREKRITTSQLSEHTPSISGKYIAYYQAGNPPADWPAGWQYRAVFYYDTTTGQETRVYPVGDEEYANLQSVIAIDNSKIVFDEVVYSCWRTDPATGKCKSYINPRYNLYLYDISNGQLSRITSNGRTPAISGDKIVWLSGIQLYMCDLSLNGQKGGCLETDEKTQITKSPNFAGIYPYIFGDKIVWQDYMNRDSSWDIWMCDLGKNGQAGGCGINDIKTRITNSAARELYPVVSGDVLAWYDNYDRIWMCDLGKNGQAGGCNPTDRKTGVGSGKRRSLSISGDRIVFDRLVSGDDWDVYIYDPNYDPIVGCEWADINNNQKLDVEDRLLFQSCYMGRSEHVGGSVVAGNTESIEGWSDSVRTPACGLGVPISLYCIEQPPVECEEEQILGPSQLESNGLVSQIPVAQQVVTQWPSAGEYYNLGAPVPMGPQAALFMMDTETYVDFLFTGHTVTPEAEVKRLGKFGYGVTVWKNKVNRHTIESLIYVMASNRNQMIFLDGHGGPDQFLIECYETDQEANDRIVDLTRRYGPFFMGGNDCTYGFMNTGWSIWMSANYFLQDNQDMRKALVYSLQCHGGGFGARTNASSAVGVLPHTEHAKGVDVFDLRLFMDYFLTEERDRPNLPWDRIGEPLHTVGQIFFRIGTKYVSFDHWREWEGWQPRFAGNERFTCWESGTWWKKQQFCLTRSTGGRGPSTSPTPRAINAGKTSVEFNTLMLGRPGSAAPVEIKWEGCAADFEMNTDAVLEERNWPDETIEAFKRRYNLPLVSPFRIEPRWSPNNAAANFGNQFSNRIDWEFSWVDEWALYEWPHIPPKDVMHHLPNAPRLLTYDDWWLRLSAEQRASWPEDQFLKIKVDGVSSWPANIELNGNPKTHLGIGGSKLGGVGKNVYGVEEWSPEDGQVHRIVPVWLRNAYDSYGAPFEYWIPCQKPITIPT
ncbi:MAG: hypothetical protein JXB14_06650 [Candidatus Altiarchaeota archaeon]|nr:hypothetical protein [Candidatus Altiarchaeota archaeon]